MPGMSLSANCQYGVLRQMPVLRLQKLLQACLGILQYCLLGQAFQLVGVQLQNTLPATCIIAIDIYRTKYGFHGI